MVYPNKTAVVYRDLQLTYAEFDERVNRLAGALREAGVRKGDRVGFLCPNVPAMLEGHYGPMRIGAVLVAINFRLSPREITYILNHSGSKVLVFDSEFAPKVRQMMDGLETVNTFVQVVDAAARDEGIPGPEYESFLASAPPGVHREELDSELDTIAINYTSGTTGLPKGVEYHSRGAYLNALGEGDGGGAHLEEHLPVDAAHVPLQRLVLHVGGHLRRRNPRLLEAHRPGGHIWADTRRGHNPYVRGSHRPYEHVLLPGRRRSGSIRPDDNDRRSSAGPPGYPKHGGDGRLHSPRLWSD